MRFLARLLALSLVVAALGGGFLYGHALGARGQGKSARQRVGRLFPFTKSVPADSDSANQQPDESVPPVNVYEDVLDHVLAGALVAAPLGYTQKLTPQVLEPGPIEPANRDLLDAQNAKWTRVARHRAYGTRS